MFRSFRDGGGIYLIPVTGGEQRRIVAGGFFPRFSPDGAWIVYTSLESGGMASVRVVPPLGGGSGRVVAGNLHSASCPIWSPDGRYVLFRIEARAKADADWMIAPFTTTPASPTKVGLGDLLRKEKVPQPAWIGCPDDWIGERILFSIYPIRSLWSVALSLPELSVRGPVAEVLGAPGFQQGRVSRTGKLVLSNENQANHLWVLPVENGRASGDPIQVTRDSSLKEGFHGTRGSLSADGTKLAFRSERNGRSDIWLKDLTSGEERALTSDAAWEEDPILNRDGTGVAYVGERKSIFIRPVEGGPARLVCKRCGHLKDWPARRAELLLSSGNSLMVLDLERGSKRQVFGGEVAISEAALSPDGDWIVVVAEMPGRSGSSAFVARLGEQLEPRDSWVHITDEPYSLALDWSPDGARLYYFSTRDGFRCIWSQPMRRGRPAGPAEPVYHFHRNQRYPWQGSWISAGRDRLVINLAENLANIWSTQPFRLP